MIGGMKRLLPQSLAGQLIALLLLALVLSQAVSWIILLDERRHAVRAADRAQVLSRTASVVRLLVEAPEDLGDRVTEAASGRRLVYWLEDEAALEAEATEHQTHPLQRELAEQLAGTGAGPVLVRVEDARGLPFFSEERRTWTARRWHDRDDEDEDEDDDEDEEEAHDGGDREHRPWRHRRQPLSLTLSVRLPNGEWLNAETLLPPMRANWAWPSLLSMLAMALAITVIVVWSVRRITQPLRALADAADGLGRGQQSPPLPEAGPQDVRRTTRAFNAMRERLERFVQDRTRMLAAVSHDLRTPITSLRLRAEFIEDQEVRGKVLETLAEMQEMIEATLAFAREDAATEDTRKVDLVALVESLCDDLADTGHAVTFESAIQANLACRPVALKRALGNLIENAVAYGERARVTLDQDTDSILIIVEDDGPGIPEHRMDEVFQPFVRLEGSRSRDTGGVGLGLAIARSILHNHGGEVLLENRTAPHGIAGLRATVTLPQAASR